MKNHLAAIVIALTLPAQGAIAADITPAHQIRFNDHIRPILSEYCFACHGPDSGSRQGDLRLDLREAAMEYGAVVPGDPVGSELIARITSDDPDTVMPPPDSHKTLTPEHRELLKRWITEGAEWQKHWSFVKPLRTQLPKSTANSPQPGNLIDRFVRQKLGELKLEPNGAADKYTLARRAAFDATGLPPSREMLKTFVADESENAWENYIGRLLSSRHYGEHRARYWLDAARYGDTHGMHVDNYREIWPYRDWVIDAFNDNMAFDRFTVEQLAGDLLPQPTREQLIATGFNRCNITTSEGGAIPAELDVRYMVDRVETTSTVFLGLTTGCAVCHDHKYDPFSQREFYQLGAFFNNTTQPAMDGNQKDTPPVVTLPDSEHQQEWDELQETRKRLRTELPATAADTAAWWPSHPQTIEHPVSAEGILLSLPLTEGEEDAVALPESARWATEHPAGKRGVRFEENGGSTIPLPKQKSDGPLSVSFWYRSPDKLVSMTLFERITTTADKKTLGWRISGNTQGGLTFQYHDGQGNTIAGNLTGEVALKPQSWQHVCVRYSGGQSNSSINVLVNGHSETLRNSSEKFIDAVDVPAGPVKIASRMATAGLSDIRIFDRWLTDDEARLLAQEFTLRRLLASECRWSDWDAQQQALLTTFHRITVVGEYKTRLQELAATQRRRDFIYSRSTTTLVMQERETLPRAWILARGEYDQREDEVAPLVPAVLNFTGAGFNNTNPLPKTDRANRLDLARWLVHPDHPLTARVVVNRLWQSVFGSGLVRTSEDFGVMGERPSHPELLDWLAVEFVESGWNVKHMLKLMLMSATYQQSSIVSREKLALDSDNRFLSRGPRFRLDAEVLRDQALAVSGLLRDDIGGPSVKPYQPPGLWRVVAIISSNTRDFQPDTGDALYRRSVYSFWKRTSPPPSMAAFNAPTREQCTVRRERTNTPIQALVLLNDPQFVEAARRLAENTIRDHVDDRPRAASMLRTVLCRPPAEDDITIVLKTAAEFRNLFQQQPDGAGELILTGDSEPDPTLDATELAAWTMVANTLMNRDDFVNK